MEQTVLPKNRPKCPAGNWTSDLLITSSTPNQLSYIVPMFYVQYIRLISAPVYRTSAIDWLHRHPWITCQKWAKIKVWGHPPIHAKGTVAIGRTVVYYAWVAHVFSAEIKWHTSTWKQLFQFRAISQHTREEILFSLSTTIWTKWQFPISLEFCK